MQHPALLVDMPSKVAPTNIVRIVSEVIEAVADAGNEVPSEDLLSDLAEAVDMRAENADTLLGRCQAYVRSWQNELTEELEPPSNKKKKTKSRSTKGRAKGDGGNGDGDGWR
jgi:hypothetical protein